VQFGAVPAEVPFAGETHEHTDDCAVEYVFPGHGICDEEF